MMRIGLVDVDGHHFPNLVLMKLASYHRQLGDSVEFVNHFQYYDLVYQSKVFTFTDEDKTVIQADEIQKGGTGYDYTTVLPDCIEHIMPDYNLYPKTTWYDQATAYGFTTRGCCNRCPWCLVPNKEGEIRENADIEEFMGSMKKVILMDNNILAHVHGLEQIEILIQKKIKVDFNQGLDARLVADCPAIVDLLSRVKYIDSIRLACDTAAQIEPVAKTIEQLKAKGIPPYRIMVYCLVSRNLDDAFTRVMKIRELGSKPFAMPYRDFTPNCKVQPLHAHFAIWVNHRPTFYSCTWEEYQARMIK